MGRHVAQPQEGGDGIKQPAGTRGIGRIDSSLHHRHQQADFIRTYPFGKAFRETGGISPIMPQISDGHPPGFHCRLIATGQRDIFKMREAAVLFAVAEEELASPDLSVVTQPRPVQDDGNHFLMQAIFQHAGCRMGVMMLYFQQRQSGTCGDALRFLR